MQFRNGGYANVASTLALIVALGGTSYAAVAIPKNSVGSKQITNSSIKSADVKNGALKAADFKAGALPAGPAGPAGPQGAVGPQGPIGPSHGFSSGSGLVFPLFWTADTQQTVTSLALPAGSYVLTAKVMGNNNSATDPADLNCELRMNGTSVDSSSQISVENASGKDRTYIPLMATATAATASTATVTCTASTGSGNWLDRGITAVKVGAIG